MTSQTEQTRPEEAVEGQQSQDLPQSQPDEKPLDAARKKTEEALDESKAFFERLGTDMRGELRKPTTGAALTGAVVIGAAVVFGAAETAVGAAAAYVTYRIIRGRRAARQ